MTTQLVHLPVFGGNVVIRADQELDRPNDEGKKYVHPPPPNLRGVIQYCKAVSKSGKGVSIEQNIRRRCEYTVMKTNCL
jgi:hypothetical protein